MAEPLAVWGAATGTIGSVLAIANYVRDRPKLEVSAEARAEGLQIRVHNHGRQTTMVHDVGYLSWASSRGLRHKPAAPFLRASDSAMKPVDPGKTAEWSVNPTEVQRRALGHRFHPAALTPKGQVTGPAITFGRVIPDD